MLRKRTFVQEISRLTFTGLSELQNGIALSEEMAIHLCNATSAHRVRARPATAQDDALDLLNQLIIQNLARAERKGERERLRTIHDLDAAAIQLKDVGKLVLNPACEDTELRMAIYKQIGKEQVERAVATIEALTRPEDDNYYEFLLNNYPTIRRFLPSLLRSIHFEGVKAAQPTLRAIEFLKDTEGRSHPAMDDAPLDLLNRAWQKLVVQPDGKVDRRFYSFYEWLDL